MKVLVTGGGGFLGGSIVKRLARRGETVVSYSRSKYQWHNEFGVESATGDLLDVNSLINAMQGCDAVIHVAAKAGFWGPPAEYFQANLEGTKAVLDACRKAGLQKLVYTSTPSVVHGGGDLNGVDESMPYPARHESAYSASKAAAISYLESLRVELRGSGINVVTICPGYIITPMTANNPYPMPFILSAEAAAQRIVSIIDSGKTFAVFPWQMTVVARLLRVLPNWLYDRLFGNAPRKPRRM